MPTRTDDEGEIELLTPADVSALTHLSVRQLCKRAKAGTFPLPIRLGHRTYAWPAKEVRDWIRFQALIR